MLIIDGIDHVVLTVKNIHNSVFFYRDVLCMRIETGEQNRTSLHFGKQKINLHEQNREFEPHAMRPTPGSSDICLVSETDMSQIIEHLGKHNIEIETGPIERTGATGKLNSVYIRDPDQNLIEIANLLPSVP